MVLNTAIRWASALLKWRVDILPFREGEENVKVWSISRKVAVVNSFLVDTRHA